MLTTYPRNFTEAYNLFRQTHPGCNEVINVNIKDGPFWPLEPKWEIWYVADNGRPPEEGPETDKGREYESSLHSADERRKEVELFGLSNNIHGLIVRISSDNLVCDYKDGIAPNEAKTVAGGRVRQLVEGMGAEGIRARLETLPSGAQHPYRLEKSMESNLLSVSEEYREIGRLQFFQMFAIVGEARERTTTREERLSRDFFEKFLKDIDEGTLPIDMHCMFRADQWFNLGLYNGMFNVIDMS